MNRRPAQLRKRDNSREQKPTEWLICCEGKSEVIYLTDLVEQLSLRSGKSADGIHIGRVDADCSRRGFRGACGRQHIELLHKVQICASKFYEKRWIVFDCDADGQPNRDQIYNNFIKRYFSQAIQELMLRGLFKVLNIGYCRIRVIRM